MFLYRLFRLNRVNFIHDLYNFTHANTAVYVSCFIKVTNVWLVRNLYIQQSKQSNVHSVKETSDKVPGFPQLLEKSWNFVIFAKYPGKMRQTLEIWGLLTVILHGNASPKTYQPHYTQHNIILTLHQSFLFYVYALFNAGKMALCKLFLKLQL